MEDEMKKFLGDIQRDDESGGTENSEQEITEEPKEEIRPRDNREVRRAKQALQAEREANIALNARLEVLTESQKLNKDVGSLDDNLLQLYGSDDNGRRAAEITQRLLEKTKADATKEALAIFQSQRDAESKEVSTQERVLDSFLEEIEDEFSVDITSNTPAARKARQEFFTLLEKVSPKDSQGRVTDFADPIATFELYTKSNKPDNSRAKDLGSRSMVRSGSSGDSKLEVSAQERYLKEAGII